MRENVLTILTWDEVREILDTCEALSCEFNAPTYKGEEYCREVLSRLRKKHKCLPPIGERYDIVLAAAQVAVGRQITAERSAENTLIRSLVAFRLHNDGYSYHEIGGYMHRDHSTVTHLYFKMRDMLSVPEAYKYEMKIYDKFESLC